jgi:hypothetical protein
LHKILLSDFELVAIKLNDESFKRFWWRTAKDLPFRREPTAVAGALELPDLLLPGNNTTQMGADCRKRNEITRRGLQDNGWFAAKLKKMSFPLGHIAPRHKDLITTTSGING